MLKRPTLSGCLEKWAKSILVVYKNTRWRICHGSGRNRCQDKKKETVKVNDAGRIGGTDQFNRCIYRYD